MPETKEFESTEQAAVERWEQETLAPVLSKRPERKKRFETVSLEEVKRLYTPADTTDIDFESDPTHAGFIRPGTAASSGRCANSPASELRKRQTPVSSI
jgi:hypothetical protein